MKLLLSNIRKYKITYVISIKYVRHIITTMYLLTIKKGKEFLNM